MSVGLLNASQFFMDKQKRSKTWKGCILFNGAEVRRSKENEKNMTKVTDKLAKRLLSKVKETHRQNCEPWTPSLLRYAALFLPCFHMNNTGCCHILTSAKGHLFKKLKKSALIKDCSFYQFKSLCNDPPSLLADITYNGLFWKMTGLVS